MYIAQYWQYFTQHAKPQALSEALNPSRDNHQPAETGTPVNHQVTPIHFLLWLLIAWHSLLILDKLKYFKEPRTRVAHNQQT